MEACLRRHGSRDEGGAGCGSSESGEDTMTASPSHLGSGQRRPRPPRSPGAGFANACKGKSATQAVANATVKAAGAKAAEIKAAATGAPAKHGRGSGMAASGVKKGDKEADDDLLAREGPKSSLERAFQRLQGQAPAAPVSVRPHDPTHLGTSVLVGIGGFAREQQGAAAQVAPSGSAGGRRGESGSARGAPARGARSDAGVCLKEKEAPESHSSLKSARELLARRRRERLDNSAER